jgi:hypothetical protein
MKLWFDIALWLGAGVVIVAIGAAVVLAWVWLSNPPD